jgi:hypothetical protein
MQAILVAHYSKSGEDDGPLRMRTNRRAMRTNRRATFSSNVVTTCELERNRNIGLGLSILTLHPGFPLTVSRWTTEGHGLLGHGSWLGDLE